MTAFTPPEGYREMLGPGTFRERIGPLYFKRDGEEYSYAFQALDYHTNGSGVIHGGMMMSFMDEILGVTAWRAIGKKRCATISLNSNFVAAVKTGDWLEAKARVVRRGISVMFLRGELLVSDQVVFTADGVWKVIGK